MKLVKRLLLPALIGTLILALTSCSFVTFHRYADEKAAKELEEKRKEAIEQIESLADPNSYSEENKKLYEILLQDAINELNECNDLETLAEILLRHKTAIRNIPTSLTFERAKILKELASYASLGDYREAERQKLEQLLAYYQSEIEVAEDADRMQVLLRLFKSDVYALKTNEAYLAEELEDKKTTLASELLGLHNPVLYREKEQKEIDTLIEEFKKDAEKVSEEAALDALYESVVAKLNELRTDDDYYQEEKEELIASLILSISETAKAFEQALPDLEAITAELHALPTKEAATKSASESLFALIENAEGAFTKLKELAVTIVKNSVVSSDYWANDQKTIVQEIASAQNTIKNCTDKSNLRSAIASAEQKLASIPTGEDRWRELEESFASDLAYHFGNLTLTAPSSLHEAGSYEELAAIIDYYAFYQIDYESFVRNTFRVKITFPHKTAQWEINEVYWYSELIRSAVGITGHFEKDGDTLVIELIPYAIATESNTKEPVTVDRYTSLVEFNSDKTGYTPREDDFNDFAYLNYTKTLSGIWNTQQLWYALEHEYIPECVPGSPAEKALERAKEILRQVVCDGMSIEEKAYAIYAWFGQNVTYDENYRKYLYPKDREHFPDELAATLNAFHAEGALFDNLAVCCSFAKSYLILLRLEGIEAYRMFVREYSDNAIDNLGKTGYGSHAFVLIRGSDGLFYYSDTEEAYNTTKDSFLIKHCQFLTTNETRWPYENGTTNMYKDITIATGLPLLYSQDLTYAGHSIAVYDEESLKAMLDAFDTESGTKIQFSVIESADTLFSVKTALDQDARFSYKTFTYGNITEYMIYK